MNHFSMWVGLKLTLTCFPKNIYVRKFSFHVARSLPQVGPAVGPGAVALQPVPAQNLEAVLNSVHCTCHIQYLLHWFAVRCPIVSDWSLKGHQRKRWLDTGVPNKWMPFTRQQRSCGWKGFQWVMQSELCLRQCQNLPHDCCRGGQYFFFEMAPQHDWKTHIFCNFVQDIFCEWHTLWIPYFKRMHFVNTHFPNGVICELGLVTNHPRRSKSNSWMWDWIFGEIQFVNGWFITKRKLIRHHDSVISGGVSKHK